MHYEISRRASWCTSFSGGLAVNRTRVRQTYLTVSTRAFLDLRVLRDSVLPAGALRGSPFGLPPPSDVEPTVPRDVRALEDCGSSHATGARPASPATAHAAIAAGAIALSFASTFGRLDTQPADRLGHATVRVRSPSKPFEPRVPNTTQPARGCPPPPRSNQPIVSLSCIRTQDHREALLPSTSSLARELS
jgi:hypothetical protein